MTVSQIEIHPFKLMVKLQSMLLLSLALESESNVKDLLREDQGVLPRLILVIIKLVMMHGLMIATQIET
jgi:hypothetical protein